VKEGGTGEEQVQKVGTGEEQVQEEEQEGSRSRCRRVGKERIISMWRRKGQERSRSRCRWV
jgi:hypothetical protein